MAPSVEQALRDAAQGLMYRSETDEPFEAFTWSGPMQPTAEQVRALGGHEAEAPVRETTVEKFFAESTTPQEWHEPAEQESVQKFRSLVELIQRSLQEAKVFRVGKPEVTIYIIGRAAPDTWSGLKTWAVET